MKFPGMKYPIGILAAALLAAGCSKHEAPVAAPRPVIVMQVNAGGVMNATLYSGEVRARHEADLAFRVAGKLIERRVNLGDRVKRGQVLARLDAQDATLASNATAQAVQAAEADVSLARAEFERAQSLAAQKFISGSALDTRRSQLQAAEARLKQAQAQASVSGNQVGYTTLVADRDGIITTMNAEAGQVVAAGQAVMRLADPVDREALIWVPESRVASIKVGDAALVRPWERQDITANGRVREVAGAADSTTRTYAVRISILQDADKFMLGSTIAAGFLQTPDKAAVGTLALPISAVFQRDGKSQVWVVGADKRVSLRALEVQAFRDDQAVIKSGLANGEQVVVVGAQTLIAGSEVNPVEQAAPVALDIKR